MTVLADGFSVFLDHWQLVLGIILIMLVCHFLVGFLLRMIFGSSLNSDEYVSLGMSGWVLLLSMASLLWFSTGVILGGPLSAAVMLVLLIFLAFTIFFFTTRREMISDSKAGVLLLFFLFGISIFLRLTFISKTVLPLYFDSAQHYLLTKNIMEYLEPSNAAGFQLPASYYHLGFHFLTGFVSSLLHADINDVILVLGQMIMASIPLSLFFIVKHETGSNYAAIFAVLLSGVGWYMPAYAANWGKYPALASLAAIQFVLSLAYLSFQSENVLPPRKRWGSHVLLVLGVLVSGFIHTRAIVIFGIAILAWLIAAWCQKLPRLTQSILFWLTVLGVVLATIFIQRQDIFGLLFDPYGLKGILVTSSILILTLPAEKAYPRLTFSCVLMILFLLLSLLISVPDFLPAYTNLTLLDRPLVEMILYLPLSLLGGLGLAGLEQALGQANTKLGNTQSAWRKYAGFLPVLLVLVNAVNQYNFYPSDCCNIVSPDDMKAIHWMNKHVPANAHILVSSTEMKVLATDSFQGYMSTDAGAWIFPLTGRKTIPFSYDSDFSRQDVLNALCKKKINYIYIGGLDPTFDNSKIRAHPDWYKILLSMPKVKVYRVIACNRT
jgi:hypothetical protein